MRRTPTTSFTGIVYLPRIRPIILPAERYCSDEWAAWSKERWKRGRHLLKSGKRPRRHPSGGLRPLTRSERKRRGQRFGRQMRVQWRAAILGVAQSDIPKGGTGWIVLRGPTVSADPGTGSGKDWTVWACEG